MQNDVGAFLIILVAVVVMAFALWKNGAIVVTQWVEWVEDLADNFWEILLKSPVILVPAACWISFFYALGIRFSEAGLNGTGALIFAGGISAAVGALEFGLWMTARIAQDRINKMIRGQLEGHPSSRR